MSLAILTALLAVGLFVSMMVLQQLGHHVARLRIARTGETSAVGLGAVEGAVFGLLGLLTAFTFSGALGRFDARREMIANEANALGTAWQIIDTLPADRQPQLRSLLRGYIDAHIASFTHIDDPAKRMQTLAEAKATHDQLWATAIAACAAQPSTAITSLVLNAFEELDNIADRRLSAVDQHPPLVIYGLLIALALGCAFLAGHSLGASERKHWVGMIAFAGAMAITVYVIVDLEYPRRGLLRIDGADSLLHEVRQQME